ncbi:MAG: ArsA family ATPase [Hydrogenobacter sp.]
MLDPRGSVISKRLEKVRHVIAVSSGKGGVGKSTLACATALRLSENHKVLLISIDPAHSLSGILQRDIGHGLCKITKNLYVEELSAEDLVEEYTKKALSVIKEMIPTLSSALEEYAKQLKHSPTALETALLDRLVDYFDGNFEFIVIDSAPTGQMVRLFYTMRSIEKWFSFLEKVAQERQKLENFMGRKDNLLELIRDRKDRVEKLMKVLKEKAVIFAVMNEDKLSAQEADSIQKHLQNFRVYKVINKCSSLKESTIGVPYVENPYGIENLKKLPVEDILRLFEK